MFMEENKVKFTEDELKSISELQQKFYGLAQLIGELHINKSDIETAISNTMEDIKAAREEERDLVKSLSDKYGAGTLDLQTGEFISNQQ